MNYINYLFTTTIFILCFVLFSTISKAENKLQQWENRLKITLSSGQIEELQDYFIGDFLEEEFASWKYELERNNLDYKNSTTLMLSSNSILIHIPTKELHYNGENHDEYFDFIYRVYTFEKQGEDYFITQRAMEEFAPDFQEYNLNLDVNIKEKCFDVDAEILLTNNTQHIILKLAKEFTITEFLINELNANYQKLGYFLHSKNNKKGTNRIRIKGRIKAPSTNNEFISMNENAFFMRMGGFAAVPSPPPNNGGRNFFSKDSTHFQISYSYPKEYKFLQYGKTIKENKNKERKQITVSLDGEWSDNLAFYAQNDWETHNINLGNTQAGFYFPKKDKKEREYIINEVDSLLQWINKKFKENGDLNINFVVLDNFVKSGLLHDGNSILAQNAEIIGSSGSGYLHEICHSAPQPTISGNYLWIKEGFTNYLSYEYLLSQKKNENLWYDFKRKYLHYFSLYEEPLINITSTRIPTYWAAYSKAAFVFRMLEAEIGKENFRESLYEIGKRDNIELSNNRSYFNIFEEISGKNLEQFEKQWLHEKANPTFSITKEAIQANKTEQIKVSVRQDKPYFNVPLEIEIKTKNKTYTKIIRVENEETVFHIPNAKEFISMNFDPDSKLFAIIKETDKPFQKQFATIKIPNDTAIYVSEDKKQEVKVFYSNSNNRIFLHKVTKGSKSSLEMTNEFLPISYSINDELIFEQDITNKTLDYKNQTLDIAEPIYPEEFIPFMFSIADWKYRDKLSLLYLYPNYLMASIKNCKLINKTENSTQLSLSYFLSDKETTLHTKNGFPDLFVDFEDVKFQRK